MSTILREITVWPGDTINHTYKVSGAGIVQTELERES
jgi:hypothetical protein